MTDYKLETELNNGSKELLKIARKQCSNSFSENFEYITTEINVNEIKTFKTKNIKPTTLKNAINQLNPFNEIYDINLLIYKAEKFKTIFEIKYFLKTSIESNSERNLSDVETMIHLKINLPPYKDESKFDINWEFGGIKHFWKMFWWKRN